MAVDYPLCYSSAQSKWTDCEVESEQDAKGGQDADRSSAPEAAKRIHASVATPLAVPRHALEPVLLLLLYWHAFAPETVFRFFVMNFRIVGSVKPSCM